VSGSPGLDSATEELILSDRRTRAHNRMWAAANLEFFRKKQGWTEEETILLSDMLGLIDEINTVRGESLGSG